MQSSGSATFLWCVLSILCTIIVVVLIFSLYVLHLKDEFVQQVNQHLNQLCDNSPVLQYSQILTIPIRNGYYEKDLALSLITIAVNTSRANCFTSGAIDNPVGFTNQLRINGIEPVSGTEVMFAYIFWNNDTHTAIISYSATELVSEWESDLEFPQVIPYGINGYKDGILMHEGFYNIYISVRSQLWNWWTSNGANINTLYITGHSLGGALSTVCAFDFADVFLDKDCDAMSYNSQECLDTNPICMPNDDIDNDPCRIQKLPIHYSFASPRVGNPLFVQTFKERLPTSIRVNNTEDVIPQLPLAQQQQYTYEQTFGSVPFTVSLGSLGDNHSIAYYYHLPLCPEVAGCNILPEP